MEIAIVTFDGFNEIDSFVALNILNRVKLPDWKAQIVAPKETVVSVNGVVVHAQQPLSFVRDADAVLFGSGRLSMQMVEDKLLMAQLVLKPDRQLIGSQCSGALFLHRLDLLKGMPVCADNATRPLLRAAGVETLSKHFDVQGNIATAGGCLASPCLAAWVIYRLANQAQAIEALRYVAPVGSEDEFIRDVLSSIGAAAHEAHAMPNHAFKADAAKATRL
jgi:transcriptional regulator GlxA family with amidase domain